MLQEGDAPASVLRCLQRATVKEFTVREVGRRGFVVPGGGLRERLVQFEHRISISEAIVLEGGRAGFGVFHGHGDVHKGISALLMLTAHWLSRIVRLATAE